MSCMEGDLEVLSPSLASSLGCPGTQKDPLQRSESGLPHSQEQQILTQQIWQEEEEEQSLGADRPLSSEEHVTLITESLTVTSNDQEKLLLLNKNTELRRVNKELMKLNEDWDQVYRSTTLGLQHRLKALELENAAVKQMNSRLLLKAEHQRSAKDYYEQALMTELKRNQELQEYVRGLEDRLHDPERDLTPSTQRSSNIRTGSHETCQSTAPPERQELSRSPASASRPSSTSFQASFIPEAAWQGRGQSNASVKSSQQEVKDLKEQLDALRCQTEIYEAEYQTEHIDHKHTLQENRKLRRKREEMRQQVALLHEQLKIYEDDFRRERSDKQILQRLLLQKKPLQPTPSSRDPVLIHRCNNEEQLLEGDEKTSRREKRKQHHPLCPKHPDRNKD